MNEILANFKPIYFVGKIFAYFPFKLLNNGSIKISIFSMIHALLVFTALDYVLYLRISHSKDYLQQGSFLSKYTVILSIAFSSFYFCTMATINFFNRNNFGALLKNLGRFDEKVRI